MNAAPPDAFPNWRIDFWVDDVDATVATAERNGGSTIVPAADGGFFRQAVIADPAGAEFSVSKVFVG